MTLELYISFFRFI